MVEDFERMVGRRIRDRRKEIAVTQTALAAALGVDQPRIVKWEKGAVPEPAILPALATALRCSTDYLLGRSPGEDEWRLQKIEAALKAPYPPTVSGGGGPPDGPEDVAGSGPNTRSA